VNLKWISITTAVLLLLAVAAVWMSSLGGSKAQLGQEGQPIMEGVTLSDVASIALRSKAHQTTLEASPQGWLVVEMQRFPADQQKVTNLLFDLREEELGYRVSDRPEKLAELGLLMPGEPDAGEESGTELVLRDASGKQLFRLVEGKTRRGAGASVGGRYVRVGNDDAAYLVANAVNLLADPETWLDVRLLSVEPQQIRALHVRASDGKGITIDRADDAAEWRVDGAPGAVINQDTLDAMIRKLGQLEFFTLAAKDAKPSELGRNKLTTIVVELFNGIAYTVQIGETKVDDENNFISASATLDAGVTDEELRGTVERFNQRFEGRVFGMYDFEATPLLKRRQDFLASR